MQNVSGALLYTLLIPMLAACTVVGPTAITTGRLAYNEAITATDNQQMLMVLVRNRYGEQSNLLAVSSVTANVNVKSSAGIQAGFGSDSAYQGNLVPFAGGIVYEENPTISYTPVTGERYLRQLTSPVPVSMVAQMARSITDSQYVLVALLSSINGIYNPDFVFADEGDDPRFDRVIRIITDLTRAHRLTWVESSEHRGEFSLVIDQSHADHAAMVTELLQLTGLADSRSDAPRIVIPVRETLNGAGQGVLGVTTRSVLDLVEILAARIVVPARDEREGMVVAYPPVSRLGRQLAIAYSPDEPEHAYISVRYRDGWYYIDERDLRTKRYFKLLGGLWSLAVASALADGPAAPVLTVPVSN